jgi:PAS domain S-box-containing protein
MKSPPSSAAATTSPQVDPPRVGEEVIASAFENAAIGMALLAPDSSRLRVNRAFCHMLGYGEQQLLGRPEIAVTHPDDLGEDLRQRALCLAGERDTYQREKRYLDCDGAVVWGWQTCTLVRDAQAKPLHFIVQVQDITERKQAEQALRESEARFRSLTMLSSDWYWEQDDQFRFVSFAGDDGAGAWRADLTLAIGHCRWDFPALQPLDITWAEHRAQLERHEPFRDLQYMWSAGKAQPRYVSCSGEPMFDAAGRFRGYRGTVRDITNTKMAEQRLRDTQALLHMAARAGRLGAWAYEVGEPHVLWSEQVCAIHEVKHGFAPTPQQALAFFASHDQEPVRAAIVQCLKDGKAFDLEAQVVTVRGRRVWVRVICEAERDARGGVRRIQGACQDISEGKRVAQEARLMAEQLSATLESLTDAFFTVDREGRFTYVNASAEHALGRKRTELLGREVGATIPDFRGSEFERQYLAAISGSKVVQFEAYYAPFQIWVQVKAYPSKQGLAIYAKNVTGRVAAQREILRLNAQLEERVAQRTAQLETANRELEAFSYSIAHDLRAPLGSIDGFSLMLEQDAGSELPARCRHYLNRIRAGVRQMGELTDGLLALANLSRTSLRAESVDLAALARAATLSCRERWPERAVEIQIAQSLPVRGDPRLLAQVIGNLVENAWKFTARRPAARIEVASTREEGAGPVYYVRDNGAGFDMAYASRMFEAFQRMHAAAEFPGTGIGLAIVHKIVTRHGGRIWAEAAPERGACFYFTLGAQAH